MIIFTSGGCKNGKSINAQHIAKKLAEESKAKLYYVATMIPKDEEDLKRVKRHLDERKGWGFETIEVGKSLDKLVSEGDRDGVYLFDSVTAFLENNLFDPNTYEIDRDAPSKVINQIQAFVAAVNSGNGSIIFVSDYIYSDSIIYDESTEFYKQALAKCDRAIAGIADEVMEVILGNIIKYK